MNRLMKSTYTYATLKEAVLKLLGEYSVNGYESSSSSGVLADMEKKYVSCLNICLRRVIMSLPMLTKSTVLRFLSGKAELPEDFGALKELYTDETGCLSEKEYRLRDNVLECKCIPDGGMATLLYKVNPKPFTGEETASFAIELPDITADALCYLTAAELCPAEYGELYSKLMYKYRDICLNAYGIEMSGNGRNSFFTAKKRKSFKEV